mgnify:CR=1 FL=1
MHIQELYQLYLQYPSIQTDTRLLQPSDLFFALKGPSFNGNTFVKQALEKGAAAAVIDDATYNMPGKTFLVDDVLTALQELAKYHREQFNIPFLAITGSNGKTTTKELIHAVLSSHYTTCTTQGNLNNHIGIPLTILRIGKDAQMAVIEMGANHQKEIEGYCIYTQPTHGIITNCGKAHLEGFGGEEGVRKGKGELYDYIRLHKGAIFRNNDYGYLQEMSKNIDTIFTYGISNANIVGSIVQNEPFLTIEICKGLEESLRISTHLVGAYNLPNILAAVVVGKIFDVPNTKMKQALENYYPNNSRSQWIEKGTNKIILDAYNANPSSMQVAIENFAALQASPKVLLLGGMAELGNESIQEHQKIIQLIQQHLWHFVVLVGKDFNNIQHPYIYFNSTQEAAEWLKQQALEHTHFLIKGSRSIAMEKIMAVL